MNTNQYNRCRNHFLFVVMFSSCFLSAKAQLFDQDSLKLISRQFAFTEGPAANARGEVFFTDQPNNRIWKYGTDGELSIFKENAGRSNGLYFDHKGRLLACADEHNELWSISRKGKVRVLLTAVGGKKLNGPNDLWADNKGGIYFTDPYYQRNYWKRQKSELEKQNVYYLSPGKNAEVRMAAGDIIKPNGIIGTPDGKFLYVADIQDNKTYRYAIKDDGSLGSRKLIISKGSDGITLDEKGNLYLTGKGVFIYSPEGTLIGHVEINEPWTANVTFGGKNNSDLFITASKAVYVLPMRVKGAQ